MNIVNIVNIVLSYKLGNAPVQENMICFNFGCLNLQRDIWCELARKQLCQTSPQTPPWDQKKERLVTNVENKRPPGEESVCVEEVVTTNASRELLHRAHRSHGVKPKHLSFTPRTEHQLID